MGSVTFGAAQRREHLPARSSSLPDDVVLQGTSLLESELRLEQAETALGEEREPKKHFESSWKSLVRPIISYPLQQ
jgi:hypothetical protein